MDLIELRKQIDKIDGQILELFSERMDISGRIAEVKAKTVSRQDSERERQKLLDVSDKSDEELSSYAVMLFSLIMELSRSYQEGSSSHSELKGEDIVAPSKPPTTCLHSRR